MTTAEVLELQEKARAHKSQTQNETFQMMTVSLLADIALSLKSLVEEKEKAASA